MHARMDIWIDGILANRRAGLEKESEREEKVKVLYIIKRSLICTTEKSLKLQDQAVTHRCSFLKPSRAVDSAGHSPKLFQDPRSQHYVLMPTRKQRGDE